MPDPSSPTAAPPASLLHAGRRTWIESAGLTIGREEGNDVMLDTPEASRRHARVFATDRGYAVEDLGSRNGTLVNGERIRSEWRLLANGDTITIGGEPLRFVTGEETRFVDANALLQQVEALQTKSVRFTGGRLTIGRDASNDVTIPDPNVSRFHAEIVETGQGKELRDLGSRNGTRVDGQLVTRALLQTGSEIGVGSYRLIFDGENFVARDDRGALRLDADQVEMVVAGGRQILQPTSFGIGPGELVAVIGESGSGKSTLIKMLVGVTQPTRGAVTVNGEPLLSRLTDIGYVPQDEIVHGHLSVREALTYAARLRLPADVSSAEVEETVTNTAEELGLTSHLDTRIERLSGGQRKRAGVATELLSRPSIVFLDEPTTGLDPGLETRLMQLLRELADNGRAVTLITHATKNLGLCDKVLVMGRGGIQCFVGRPQDALGFFGVDDYDGIYRALDTTAAEDWRQRFYAQGGQTEQTSADRPAPTAGTVKRADKSRKAGFQARILTSRYFKLFTRDRRNMAILFGQVPIIALAIALLFQAGVFEEPAGDPSRGQILLFLLVTVAIWFGSIAASREIIKERSVFERERAVGVRLPAYLFSKVAVLFLIVAVQVVVLTVIVLAVRPIDEPVDALTAVVITLLLTSFVSVGMGLIVSAAVSSEDQATSFIPLTLIPQLLFAGALVPVAQMSGVVEPLSNLVFARWAFASSGTWVDLDQRIGLSGQQQVLGHDLDFFDVDQALSHGILVVFLVLFLGVTLALLRRRGT